ncbi:MAG: serine/threonine-protein kinase [Kofleriaceae bacterium]
MASDPDDDSHDTDPLADTAAPAASGLIGSKKKRGVHTGDTLGRYELGEEAGEGGMATVYRARDKELRRDVAIKVLFPHLARRPEIVRRFHREARAAAGLEHANILRVYDVGGDEDSDDPPFIVMELVRGTTLLGEIELRGPMFAEVVACVGALLADALAAAHAAGIIHRDIKPANVLVAPGGKILLADFGVARLETEDSLVTKTGALLGTPAYMSPEQASGDIATAKSDLYSLGATLYQLATGTLPYAGSPAKVMAAIALGSRISAVKRRAEVGPDLSRVIDRLMASEPEDRPASAKEVATELRAIATAGGLGDPVDELEAYFADPPAFVTAKIPKLVTALVEQGKQAIAEAKLPRALAIANRASALAPEDPTVTALISAVTEGGRSTTRRRVLIVGALGVVAAAAATLAGIKLLAHRDVVVPDATAIVAATPADAPQDALEVPPVVIDAAVTAPIDASVRHVVGVRDAAPAIAMVALDAALPPDAAPPDAAPIGPQMGTIVVNNDTWCDVGIDHAQPVRNTKPFVVEAGHHYLACTQPGTDRAWTREVDVAANTLVTVTGTMLAPVTITFEIAATLNGTVYASGATTTVKPGYARIEANGVKKDTTVREPCVIRDRPELGCFPR